MQVLKEITLDKVINLYELKERTLAQDKMILGALKCARANGYSDEE